MKTKENVPAPLIETVDDSMDILKSAINDLKNIYKSCEEPASKVL